MLNDTIENASEALARWCISLARWNFRFVLPLPGSYRKTVSPRASPGRALEGGQPRGPAVVLPAGARFGSPVY